ncbi:5-formyltetrahydrofolate cyclo-ligase [Candidatus Peregrinibacteria bacterium]|nr:5-formyltetrahydrofolate cyclo-ligase [Candidatus Peregrinibacteria bacterium]
MKKNELRKKAIKTRNALSAKIRAAKSLMIRKKLENMDAFRRARHILFYYAHGSEVDTLPLLKNHMTEKVLYLPKLMGKNQFMALPFPSLRALRKGIYGIPEPVPAEEIDMAPPLDLIIIPGVAFDRRGNRLGMGKGYYDRFLKAFKAVPKIALAFEEQVLAQVPKEIYDEPVDLVLTDQAAYNR